MYVMCSRSTRPIRSWSHLKIWIISLPFMSPPLSSLCIISARRFSFFFLLTRVDVTHLHGLILTAIKIISLAGLRLDREKPNIKYLHRVWVSFISEFLALVIEWAVETTVKCEEIESKRERKLCCRWTMNDCLLTLFPPGKNVCD